MSDTRNLSPSELRDAAVQAVVDEVGVAGLIRFIQDISPGEGDYTKERWNWLRRDQSIEELVSEVQETEKALGLDKPDPI